MCRGLPPPLPLLLGSHPIQRAAGIGGGGGVSIGSKGNLVVCKRRSPKVRASTTICIGFSLKERGFRLAPPSK